MQLLDFRMPPFARTVWASKDIKEKWKPLYAQCVQLYATLERETVKAGLRDCTTAHIDPRRLGSFIGNLAKEGLMFLPIRKIGQYAKGGFSHSHPPLEEGKPWSWYGVIARDLASAKAFAEASNTQDIDHLTIGKLLGYPECCLKFFNEVWRAGYIDPIWQQAQGTSDEHIKKRSEHMIRIKNTIPYEANVMLRYSGVRLVPHIPCSHDCKETVEKAQAWGQLARDLNLEGMDAMEQFLRLPLEWDCLKGIAYVSSPLFKIETNSMTCYPNYIVQKEGTFFPEEAPRGLKFPWNELPTKAR